MIGTDLTARIARPTGKIKVQASTRFGTASGYTPSVGAGLLNVGKAIGSLDSNGPPATPDTFSALTADNALLTLTNLQELSGGRVLEVTPAGKIVHSFTLLNAADGDFAYLVQSTVLANGQIATVGSHGSDAFLILTDPLTGTSTRVTQSGWSADSFSNRNEGIASIGNQIFVCNGTTLLRYDVDAGTWQNFGGALFGANYYHATYLGVVASKDGRIYASANGPTTISLLYDGPNEIYDPNTLLVVGHFPRALGCANLAFDVAGDAYVPQVDTMTNGYGDALLKLNPAGAVIASGKPSGTNTTILSQAASIQVASDGTLYVVVGDQLLVSDTTFSQFKAFTPLLPSDNGGDIGFAVSAIDP